MLHNFQFYKHFFISNLNFRHLTQYNNNGDVKVIFATLSNIFCLVSILYFSHVWRYHEKFTHLTASNKIIKFIVELLKIMREKKNKNWPQLTDGAGNKNNFFCVKSKCRCHSRSVFADCREKEENCHKSK